MPESLTTVLGFEAKDAIATLGQMQASLAGYTSAMNAAGNATKLFNRSGNKVESTLNRVAKTTQVANAKTSGYYKQQAKAIKDTTKVVEGGAAKQEQAAKRVLLSWQSVVRIFAIQVIHQMVTKITNSMWEGVTAAREYEIALAEIQTIAVGFRGDLEGLSDQVREFSDAVGAPIESVAEGVYQALSNQVTDAAHAFEFMTSAQAFAIASVTETQSAVALLSAVMNSYNIEMDRSAEVGGKLAKIIEKGRLRGEEFANTFGRITVLASQLNISLDEVGATVATLTVSGLKYNEASTLMLNIMLKLIRPTEELKNRFKELGISGAEAGIQAYGFQGFLDKLSESAGSSATELGKLFGRVRAIRGVMGLANENAERYAENLEAIRAAGPEELFKKRDIIFETNAKQVEVQLNKLRNTMVVGFGRNMNDMLKALFDTFGGGVETLKAFGYAAGAATAALVILKAQAIATAAALFMASAAFPPMLIVAGVAAATIAIIAFFNKAKAEVIEMRRVFEEQNEKAFQIRIKQIHDENDAQKESNDKALGNIQKYLFERKKEFDLASKELLKIEENIFSDITTQLHSKISATTTFFNNLQKQAANSAVVIQRLNNTIKNVKLEKIDFDFERALRGLTPLQTANKQLVRYAKQRIVANNKLFSGDFKLAELYFQRAKASAQAALSAADESRNRDLIAEALEVVKETYTDEVALLERKKRLTKKEKEIIEDAATQIAAQRSELKLLNSEIQLTIKEFDKVRFDPVKREEVIAKLKTLVGEAQDIFDMAAFGFGLPSDAKIVADFRAILGQDGEINKLVATALDNLNTQLNAFTARRTAFDTKMEMLLPGAKTIEERQAGIVELKKLLEKSTDAVLDRAKAENIITRGLNDNVVLLEKIRKAYADSAERASVFGMLFRSAGQLAGMDIAGPFDDAKEKAELARYAMDLTADAIILLRAETLDLDVFKGTEEALANLAATPGATDAVKMAIKELLINLHILEEAKIRLQKGEISILSPEEKERALQTIRELQDELGVNTVNASNIGTTIIIENLEKEVAAVNAVTRAFAKRNLAAQGNTVEKQFGGMIYRAGGGWVPRGTDTIPAMLTPGEFVMNATASRKFYSQLTAMNSGVNPQYRARGGPVTNIGDVSITVNEANSAKQTARETMQAFRRETRRGAFTL